jgi:crotonobetainyl-CoA:carnitine CoA-transferase CaiB-like acyl-CoA transferase
MALELLAGDDWRGDLDAPALLGERAAIFGLTRRGATSPSGSCRLLACSDGWLAVNLARTDDIALLPAWLEETEAAIDPADPWPNLCRSLRSRSHRTLVARARLMGLPVAPVAAPPHAPPAWLGVDPCGTRRPRHPGDHPLVVDISSLWAGPLCGQLLLASGARVIKLESATRPDGARFGPAAFFDLLNAGKQSVALDFGCSAGLRQLVRLLEAADIVVESARPRALAQLGIDARALVADRPGASWVSITGYGRREPEAGWVAFGDDAAAASGLCAALQSTQAEGGPPLFCGDAIADPLAGMHAAVAALASWKSGGGRLLDVPLCATAAHALAFEAQDGSGLASSASEEVSISNADGGWHVTAAGQTQEVLCPRARSARRRAPTLGADTETVLRELGIP